MSLHYEGKHYKKELQFMSCHLDKPPNFLYNDTQQLVETRQFLVTKACQQLVECNGEARI